MLSAAQLWLYFVLDLIVREGKVVISSASSHMTSRPFYFNLPVVATTTHWISMFCFVFLIQPCDLSSLRQAPAEPFVYFIVVIKGGANIAL